MAKVTKLVEQVTPHINTVLGGTLLAIDPSSGSKGSQPGYALYHAGELQSSGYLNLGSGYALERRLYALGKCLREEFDKPDILVTEKLAAFFGEGKQTWSTGNVISLHQSVGVVMSVWDTPLVQVAPMSWRQHIPANYKKGDEADAVMLGYTALFTAAKLAGREFPMTEEIRYKITTGEWK